MIFWRSNCKTL